MGKETGLESLNCLLREYDEAQIQICVEFPLFLYTARLISPWTDIRVYSFFQRCLAERRHEKLLS